MPARLYIEQPLREGEAIPLAPGPTRHVQVLRLQPGAALTLFDGHGGEWSAEVLRIGRRAVDVRVGGFVDVDRELPLQVVLAVGMPANERMDALVEKATELGAAAIQPLVCERSVLRLHGERAERKVAHWRGVAVAAAEQCGRTRVPGVAAVRTLTDWLRALPSGVAAAGGASAPPEATAAPRRVLLSLAGAPLFAVRATAGGGNWPVWLLSGPEGGLTAAEEAAGRAAGFRAASLGPRTLRADTAPLAALALLAQTAATPPQSPARLDDDN